jgi:outer membrane lipoprotein SlyB
LNQHKDQIMNKNSAFPLACLPRQTRRVVTVTAVCLVSLLSGCASYDTGHQSRDREVQYDRRDESQYGTVSNIEVIATRERTSGGGAILGAILGAAIGNQVGDGDGRRVATGAGAIGGAVIGNNIERRNKRDGEIYRVRVRMNNGRDYTADYQRIDDLDIGDRVRIEDGQIYRM